MSAQQDTPNFPDPQTIIAALGSAAAGILGFLKFLDTRKSTGKSDKNAREDWLIENAFEIVKQLRSELERARKESQEGKEENDKLQAIINGNTRKIRTLETLLIRNGIELP